MGKIIITLLVLFVTQLLFAQTYNQKLIDLGKAYNNFMFRNDAAKEDIKEIKLNMPGNLKSAGTFIIQTLTRGNKLLTQENLSRPDDQTLKQIYIIRALSLNFREENQIESNKLIDSLSLSQISTYVLVDNYYDMLFTAVGNKNQPFDLSKINIKIKDYNLRDDTEKGILFLEAMSLCDMTIWGYMNVVNPPNTQKAFDNIKKFPKFNDRPYYQYTDLYFPDFEMIIIKDEGMQSYKSYYINKYYEVLISHLICLNKEGGSEKEKEDLLLGSILKNRDLYKYSKYKDALEGLFKEQKTSN